MASNEDRARLCGWEPTANGWVYVDKDGFYPCPAYDTSRDACAELLRFVRERGKVEEFVDALYDLLARTSREIITSEFIFDLIDATPAQQCAAFDATFKDGLEKIHE